MLVRSILSIALMSVSLVAQDVAILRETERDFSQVAEKAIPTVVSIQAKSKKGESGFLEYDPSNEFFQDDFFGRFFGAPRRDKVPNQLQITQGSGFLVSSDGYILTNSHVVKDNVNLTIKLNDGREFPGKVIGEDDSTDVAVVKIDAKDLPYLTLGNSDDLHVGQWVAAIGNPLGLQASLTVGVVSAKGRSNLDLARVEDFIQTDAAINRGNSGGPLLNMHGEVIGINTAIATNLASGGYMGIGFAIPSNMAKNVMDQLLATGSVTRGYLGVVLQEINNDLAQAFELNKVEGALVAEVLKNSPAEKAGLKQGDIILKINQRYVESIGSLRNFIALQQPGTKVILTILRNKSNLEIPVTVEVMKDEGGDVTGEKSVNSLGIEVQALTPDLAETLGHEIGRGVVVLSVNPNSPAALTGLKKGALILAVNQKPVSSKQEFNKIIKDALPGRPILFLIKQGDSVRYLSIRLNA